MTGPKIRKALPARKPELQINHALTDWEFLQLVLEVVEKAYGVPDVTVRGRPRRISEARQLAMYLARVLSSASYPTIGDAFSRDHTTVMHAEKRVRARLLESGNFKAVVWRLIQTIEREAASRSEV